MDGQIEAVQRMQDYISEHISENLDIGSIAKQAGYSPWHARRLFIQYVGISPANYIRKLRLRNSALRLRDEKVRILDAALDCGFESVDGYQRAFFSEFGCNPMDYAKKAVPIPLYTPYGVKSVYKERKTEAMEAKTVFVQVIEKPARKAIIKRGIKASDYFAYCEEVGCDVWGILTSMRSLSGEPVCMWLPKEYIKPGTSEYVQGAEVAEDYDGIIPEGFDVISLPAAEYLQFRGEPFAEEDYGEAISQVWDAEKKFDPSSVGYAWDKSLPTVQLEPIGTRGYIELLPVRKI